MTKKMCGIIKMKTFSLNTKAGTLYYSLLQFITISLVFVFSNYCVYKEPPSNKQIQQFLMILLGIIFFHLVIDPSVTVDVLNDEYNNDHITKI